MGLFQARRRRKMRKRKRKRKRGKKKKKLTLKNYLWCGPVESMPDISETWV